MRIYLRRTAFVLLYLKYVALFTLEVIDDISLAMKIALVLPRLRRIRFDVTCSYDSIMKLTSVSSTGYLIGTGK
jgi:hypothetical protein